MEELPIYGAERMDNGVRIISATVGSFSGVLKMLINEDRRLASWMPEHIVPTWVEVDRSSLSIHFPGWLDKNGNAIWAAINETKAGASLVSTCDECSYLMEFINGCLWYRRPEDAPEFAEPFYDNVISSNGVVTGVYKGDSERLYDEC